MALISTTHIIKTFTRGSETIHALNDISFSIDSGEFVSIIGPSGCGKSTLMYILGLIDTPSSGDYVLDGISISQMSEKHRAQLRNQKIGFVFQSFHLLPRASALRNVAMPLVYSASYDRSFSEQKMHRMAEEALERVGLGQRIHHRPNELSGGQRQRVAIARALVNNPQIIFADEPTGNLDSRSGNEIVSLFEELNRAGVTVIIVTHDSQLAQRTKRIIALHDGVIQRDTHAN